MTPGIAGKTTDCGGTSVCLASVEYALAGGLVPAETQRYSAMSSARMLYVYELAFGSCSQMPVAVGSARPCTPWKP